MSKKHKLISILGFVLFILVCVGIWQSFNPKLHYEWVDINGKSISSKDYENQLVLINYWATWCPPCVREMPALSEFQAKYANQVQVIGITYDRIEVEKIKTFIDGMSTQNPITYPIVMQLGNDLSQFPSIRGLPTTLILHHNKLVETHTGELFEQDLERLVNQYLEL